MRLKDQLEILMLIISVLSQLTKYFKQNRGHPTVKAELKEIQTTVMVARMKGKKINVTV